MTQVLKPIRDLPDVEGFEFIGVDKDGREVLCRMRQLVTSGKFYIAGTTAFTELIGWKRKP